MSVSLDGDVHSIGLPAAKNHKPVQNDYLSYVLDPAKFAGLSNDERRAMLFGLMGVTTKIDDIRDRLTKRGHSESRIKEIMPYVRAGFDEAMGEAKSRATEQKGAWKSITGGETYGAVKAAEWKAKAPPAVEPGGLDEARADLVRIDAEIETETARLGEQRAIRRQAEENVRRIDELEERAGKRARIADKLERDRAELKTLESNVEALREKAGVKPAQNTVPHPCPHCGGLLLIQQGRVEEWHDETLPHYDAEAASALPEHERALKTMQNAVANGERDLAAADAAAAELADLKSRDQNIELLDLEAMQARIDVLKHSRGNQSAAIRLIEDAARAAAQADENTAKAAAAHALVQEWEAVAESLSPAGIRADLLAEAVAPFNSLLARNAEAAGWMIPRVADDMSVETAFGRPYALLSESEKWRMNAIIAAAIAERSGLRMLMLDRFDVLDLQARAGLVGWINGEIGAGRLDSAIIAGTLKTLPSGLPSSFSAFWIENGTVRAEILEAA